jgi:spore coat polysaccharide biosynthesis predicted glycosyltransferase SpsG
VGRISDLDWVSERITKLGFSQVILDEDLFKSNVKSDVLILDSYSNPISNPFIAKKNWKLMMSICDELTPPYDSDIKLCPGFTENGPMQGASTVLSGADHILIRKGIIKSQRSKKIGGVLKVLVVGGGSDPFGFVPAIAKVFSSMKLNLEVHMFSNDMISDNSAMRFVMHQIGSDFDSIASDVDVVFTTASTSSLEFIAREIPTGIVCAVDNQANYYDQLGQRGYASQLGKYNSSGNWDFDLLLINELLESQEKRDSLKKSIRSLIDLKGAARVIDTLVSLT